MARQGLDRSEPSRRAWPEDEPGAGCEFRCLGPFVLETDGAPVEVGRPKERALLALLLVAPERQVTLRQISLELWDGYPPESAVENIRSYLCNLRRRLPPGAVVTGRHSYALRLPGCRVDADEFAGLLAKAAREEDPEAARVALEQALALWHGGPLSGVPHGTMLGGWARAMDGHRKWAVTRLAEVLLRLGQPQSAQVMLRRHLLSYPLHEAAHALLVRALHQGGDPLGALQAYEAARRLLCERLGMDPGPGLAAAHHAVITQRGRHGAQSVG